MSCNGCRVLRKGCSDSCALRPCLQWIEGAEAQGHATVFVAKFFGRAGLMGFIGAVPDSQRPALFRSLLYEACGRTVNPVYGAVGLLWSGHWHICQAAVDTVLRGGSLKPTAGTLPSNLPCYGPMPNLPRPRLKSPPLQQALDLQEDVKRFNLPYHHLEQGQSFVKNKITGEDPHHVINRNCSGPSDAPVLVAVKRERDEAAEIIAPVAKRPRVSRPSDCKVDMLPTVDAEAIDLDLTLSSHPPTPQLFLPPRRSNNAALTINARNDSATNTATPAPAAPAAGSPVSCSNSFSSEGSVTSLDTVDFIGSNSQATVPGMNLLQKMERKHHHHHSHSQPHHSRQHE